MTGQNVHTVSQSYDAIVIGGGHNGLTAAAYLARAGRRVLVLERRHLVGGASVTEELFPGFKHSVCSYVVSLLRPEIIRELDLAAHGLSLLPLDGTFTPLADGNSLWRSNDHAATYRELARHSRLDADAYDDYNRTMLEISRALKPLFATTPPDPFSMRARGIRPVRELSQQFVNLPENTRHQLLKLMTMSAVEFLDQWFETDALKATMGASGIIGTFLGVRSPGTAYVLLHHYLGEIDGASRSWALAKGGTGAVADALASAARAAGADIRVSSPVRHILVDNGRTTGAVLENGDYFLGSAVLSTVDARATFSKLIQPDQLPAEFEDAIRRFKFRGCSSKVNLSLDGLPDFTCRPGAGHHLRGAISISPSVDYMERAYDDAKYGAYSKRPYIDIVIPSLTDPTLAPPGKHVMSCFAQYSPYELRESNWDDERDALGDVIIDTVADYAPNIKDLILHRQVLTPLDLEREFGLTEGNIFHGELTAEQLFFMRPVPGWASYETPIQHLYLAGSSAHPGGGITGAPGRNAAVAVMKATRK
jgi:phytoene dehydrogenase-like protein